MNYKIIDSHSHLGMGYKHYASIQDYQTLCNKYNIVSSIIMPQPFQKVDFVIDQPVIDKLNQEIWDIINNYKSKNEYYFVPIISPRYTSISDLERYIKVYKPKAFKIHFKYDESYPQMITEDFALTLKKSDIPLIVHTDYAEENITEKDRLKNLNSARCWLEFFKKYKIKGYLTHGARLDVGVLKEVNKLSYMKVGLGPDLLLQSLLKSEYLKILKNNLSASRLCFDVDFNWNYTKKYKYDYGSKLRVISTWDKKDCKKIFYNNAKKFFKLKG